MEEAEYQKIINSRLRQNTMPEWRPVNTPKRNTIIFCVCGAILLGIGIGVLYGAQQIHSISIPFNCTRNINCVLDFSVLQFFKGPIFLYYKFAEYYQNHRIFASSLSYNQLSGNNISKDSAQSFCYPVVTMRDVGSLEGTNLSWDDVANPCGLAPKYYYNGNCMNRHF